MTKVTGLDALRRKLNALGPATKTEIRSVLQVSANEMVSLAKSLVAPNTQSGDLQLSIHSRPGRHDLAIEVAAGGAATTREVRAGSGVEYDYALANEFGTSEMEAQPFFWPSYRAIKKRAKNRATRAVRKAARAAVAGGG